MIFSFALFILNDLVDQRYEVAERQAVLNIKLESSLMILIAYFIIGYAVSLRAEVYERGISYIFKSSSFKLQIKLQTEMHVTVEELGRVLIKDQEHFNFQQGAKKKFDTELHNNRWFVSENDG